MFYVTCLYLGFCIYDAKLLRMYVCIVQAFFEVIPHCDLKPISYPVLASWNFNGRHTVLYFSVFGGQDNIDERNIVWLFEIDGLDTEEMVPTDVISFAIGIKNLCA